MDFKASAANAAAETIGCVVVGVFNGRRLSQAAEQLDKRSHGALRGQLKSGDLRTNVGACSVLTGVSRIKPSRVLVVGLGNRTAFDARIFRRATAAAASRLLKTGAKRALFCLGLECSELDAHQVGMQTSIALGTAMYRFNEYKSGKKPKRHVLKSVVIGVATDGELKSAADGAKTGWGIARGMDLTRDLGNTPPNVCTPTYLADTARDLERRYSKIDLEILDEPDMAALGMGSLLSVGHGSEQPSKLIVARYSGGNLDEPPIAMVGKGITFDTGGTSLKPGPSMDEMKYDMCGAAAVLGTLLSAAALRLPVNLLVIVAAAENMPGSRASRPGDIVTSMSGKTIEILNTDAEGRLVLCDALTYAKQYKPSAMIDVATLTGACVVALGRHNSGLLANDDDLASDLLAAGKAVGDGAWQLPIGEDYAEQLHSNFADMANIGGREAGTITAACFLSRFTTGTPWAHLDIAGTAWLSGARKGGTGRPVPLLTQFLLDAVNRAAGAA